MKINPINSTHYTFFISILKTKNKVRNMSVFTKISIKRNGLIPPANNTSKTGINGSTTNVKNEVPNTE